MKKFWESNHKIIKFILTVFVIWQIVISSVSFFSSKILPERSRFMYNDGVKIINPVWLWNRANFDGAHYLEISRKGYGLYQQAFFPFYPRLIKFLTPVFAGKDLLAAIFISNFSLLLLLYFFYKLVLLDFNDQVARRSIMFFLIFPTSFFLSCVYTESLFIFLVLACFYAARTNRWLVAGIFGLLASYTRITGILLFPALLYELYQGEKDKDNNISLSGFFKKSEKIKNLLSVLLVPIGILSYMKYLSSEYKDCLLFLHVQPFFGAERSANKIILIYQVFWRYLKMILTSKLDFLYFAVWLELLVAILFLIIFAYSIKKKIRTSYLVFAILSFFMPTLSGTFLSLPRFALAFFPCFIYLGTIKNKVIRISLLTIFGITFLVSSALFFRGYWLS